MLWDGTSPEKLSIFWVTLLPQAVIFHWGTDYQLDYRRNQAPKPRATATPDTILTTTSRESDTLAYEPRAILKRARPSSQYYYSSVCACCGVSFWRASVCHSKTLPRYQQGRLKYSMTLHKGLHFKGTLLEVTPSINWLTYYTATYHFMQVLVLLCSMQWWNAAMHVMS